LQFPGYLTDELLRYFVSLGDLTRALSAAGGHLVIVGGEVDVWSSHAFDISNVIGTHCADSIPHGIASNLDELRVSKLL
jgi:hypothetical protein